MRYEFSIVALLVAIPAFATASSYKPKVHHVQVGRDGKLAYHPEQVNARVGDTIRFLFNPKAHSVTQSIFPLGDSCSPKYGGFDSDLRPVATQLYHPNVTFDVPVKDDKPIWVYCKQQMPKPHCGQGMVFAVNAPKEGNNTFDAFKQLALRSATNSAGYAQAEPKTHYVQVGRDGNLTYYPEQVQAAVGDTIKFLFNPKAHSVTQSAFPLGDSCSPRYGGFDSDLRPVTVQLDHPTEQFEIQVKDNDPIWVYCKQQNPKPHCGQGMVFAVNAPGNGTFNVFKDLAKKSAYTPNANQTGYPPPGGQTHYVQVGRDGNLTYYPEQVQAAVGDTIKFLFNPKAHSVTESAFPLGDSCSPKYGGFDSDLRPVPVQLDHPTEQFEIQVKDNKPIWVYCKQQNPKPHCGQGMVFAVNAPKAGNNTFDAFKQLAAKSAYAAPTASKAATVNLSGNLGHDDSSGSPDLNTLIRNGYIVMGLLAAVLLMVVVLLVVLVKQKRSGSKYSPVTTDVPTFESTKPYSTPY